MAKNPGFTFPKDMFRKKSREKLSLLQDLASRPGTDVTPIAKGLFLNSEEDIRVKIEALKLLKGCEEKKLIGEAYRLFRNREKLIANMDDVEQHRLMINLQRTAMEYFQSLPNRRNILCVKDFLRSGLLEKPGAGRRLQNFKEAIKRDPPQAFEFLKYLFDDKMFHHLKLASAFLKAGIIKAAQIELYKAWTAKGHKPRLCRWCSRMMKLADMKQAAMEENEHAEFLEESLDVYDEINLKIEDKGRDDMSFDKQFHKLILANSFQEAFQLVSRKLIDDRDNPIFHMRKGDVFAFMENFDEAEAAYLKIFDSDPYYYEAYIYAAFMFQFFGENEKALKYYSKYIEKVPHDLELLARTAYLEELCGDPKKAQELFKICMEISVDEPGVRYDYGRWLKLRKKHLKAVQVLEDTSKNKEFKVEALFEVLCVHMEMGNIKAARQTAHKIMDNMKPFFAKVEIFVESLVDLNLIKEAQRVLIYLENRGIKTPQLMLQKSRLSLILNRDSQAIKNLSEAFCYPFGVKILDYWKRKGFFMVRFNEKELRNLMQKMASYDIFKRLKNYKDFKQLLIYSRSRCNEEKDS